MELKKKILVYMVLTCMFFSLLYLLLFHFIFPTPPESRDFTYKITGEAALLFFLLLTAGFLLTGYIVYMKTAGPLIHRAGASPRQINEENIGSEEAERMLVLNEKLLFSEKVAANISHKLNNVLFTISNSFQLIKRYLPGDNKRVTDAALLLEREIKKFKNLSLDMDAFVLRDIEEPEQSDIAAIMNGAINIVKGQKQTQNTEIIFKQQDLSFPVLCNPGSLRQAFMNLILNAVEAMPGKGQITIEISRVNRDYRVDFIDNGPGIPDAFKAGIFLPLQPGKPGSGTGLGLRISHNIFTNHGGTITLNDNYQRGTHFIINIPKELKGGRSNDKDQVNTISR
jgi:signal transduction histidine kinase